MVYLISLQMLVYFEKFSLFEIFSDKLILLYSSFQLYPIICHLNFLFFIFINRKFMIRDSRDIYLIFRLYFLLILFEMNYLAKIGFVMSYIYLILLKSSSFNNFLKFFLRFLTINWIVYLFFRYILVTFHRND